MQQHTLPQHVVVQQHSLPTQASALLQVQKTVQQPQTSPQPLQISQPQVSPQTTLNQESIIQPQFPLQSHTTPQSQISLQTPSALAQTTVYVSPQQQMLLQTSKAPVQNQVIVQNQQALTQIPVQIDNLSAIPDSDQPGGTTFPKQSQAVSITVCIRSGCNNPAVDNPEWEDEYCSNECVVTHCK